MIQGLPKTPIDTTPADGEVVAQTMMLNHNTLDSLMASDRDKPTRSALPGGMPFEPKPRGKGGKSR